jgi:hypothetical protein
VSAFPKALLALLLVLPGGLILAPVLLLCMRWYAKREARQTQTQSPQTQVQSPQQAAQPASAAA